MINNGWIKLHRKIMDNPVYQNSELFHLFIHCLLKANHKDKKILFNSEEIIIKRGQFITGRFKLAKELRQKTGSVYKRITTLAKLNILDIKSNNKFSIISILNYDTYQDMIEDSEHIKEQQRNNKGTTKEQQSNTNKNDKKDNNDKKEEIANFSNSPTDAKSNSIPQKQVLKENDNCPAEKDFIEKVIDIFKEQYLYNRKTNYISIGSKNLSSGKDRKAVGGLLKYVKQKYPDDNSEDTLKRFANLFSNCFKIKDTWLKNNLTLSIIFSKLNEINETLKNEQLNNTNGGSNTSYSRGFDIRKNTWIESTLKNAIQFAGKNRN